MKEIVEMKKVKVQFVNKGFLIVILLLMGLIARGEKKYLILDSKDTRYSIKHYKMHTNELYKTNLRIELYNVIFPKKTNQHERILVISALPDLSTGKLWKEIKLGEVEGNAIDPSDYIRFESPVTGFKNNVFDLKKFNEIKLVKHDSGRWWVSTNCLIESFEIVPQGLPYFPSIYGQIVLDQNPVTINEFIKNFPPTEYKDILGLPFLLTDVGGQADNLNGWRTWKEFLSKKITVNGNEEGFQFWTSAATNVADSYDVSQGLGRFIYIPGKGIIGGSYDFYFMTLPGIYLNKPGEKIYSHRLTSDQWNENIINEKIMIAEGFTID